MIELSVSGMHCDGCVRTVEKVVRREDGNAKVAVDLAGGKVSIESRLPAETFIAAIDAAGYEAAPAA